MIPRQVLKSAPQDDPLPCAGAPLHVDPRIPFPREALAGFPTHARGWHRRSPLGWAAQLLAQTRWSCQGGSAFPGKTKNRLLPAGASAAPARAPAGGRFWDGGVQIPVPEVARTMTGTRQARGTTAGTSTGSARGEAEPPRLRRCPAAFPVPAPAAAAADSSRPCQEMSFSSGEVFAQWLPPRPHPARHTRARARRLRLLFAPMATCEGPHASFLPLLFLGSPSAGNAGLGAAGVAGGGGQAVTLVGLSGYCPALRPSSGNPGGFN